MMSNAIGKLTFNQLLLPVALLVLKKIFLPMSPHQDREASQNYTDEASVSAASAAVQLLS